MVWRLTKHKHNSYPNFLWNTPISKLHANHNSEKLDESRSIVSFIVSRYNDGLQGGQSGWFLVV
jgi:hypothetical protein